MYLAKTTLVFFIDFICMLSRFPKALLCIAVTVHIFAGNQFSSSLVLILNNDIIGFLLRSVIKKNIRLLLGSYENADIMQTCDLVCRYILCLLNGTGVKGALNVFISSIAPAAAKKISKKIF